MLRTASSLVVYGKGLLYLYPCPGKSALVSRIHQKGEVQRLVDGVHGGRLAAGHTIHEVVHGVERTGRKLGAHPAAALTGLIADLVIGHEQPTVGTADLEDQGITPRYERGLGHADGTVLELQHRHSVVLYATTGHLGEGGGNGLGLAQRPFHQIHGMRAQIHHSAATTLGLIIEKVGEPVIYRAGVGFAELGIGDLAQLATVQKVTDYQEGGLGLVGEADGEGNACLLHCRRDSAGILGSDGQNLFGKDMLARLCRLDHQLGMEIGRRGDAHRIDGGISQKCIVVLVEAGAVFLGVGASSVGDLVPYRSDLGAWVIVESVKIFAGVDVPAADERNVHSLPP